MRRVATAILLCVLLLLAASAPAVAQARDPFRPPAGSGATPGEVARPPAAADGAVAPPGSGGLPRTGQDLVLLITMASALMAAGGALRLTGRALAA